MNQRSTPKMRRSALQIDADDLLDVRVLDLDRDLLAAVQARAVDLADRRRGHRLGRELGEQLARAAAAELLAQARLDVAVGPRRHLILQPLELLAERVGQEVGHDADQLADLDEQAPQPQDRGLDAGARCAGAWPGSARSIASGRRKRRAIDSTKYESATWVVTK